jgi:serine/threonine-protein kinase
MKDACLETGVLVALLNDALSPPEEQAAEQHLEFCVACRDLLQRLADAADVMPGFPLPAQLREAADSQRLREVVQDIGRHAPASRTIVGKPDTDVVQQSGVPLARGGFDRRPERIGDYQVQAVLGRGGLGVVYRATDCVLGRDVAIKLLRSDIADHDAMRERFLREARAAAAIRHDNVVAIYGVGEHAGQPYLVMEYVPGGSLADRLLRKGKLSCREVIRLGIEVASGLAAAHAKGIIHRDVKPGNVLWDAEAGRYKLTDFGLAKALDEAGLTRTGVLAGTPEYLSPEQAEGTAIDARSDLFSLGSLLYAACAGVSPFHAETTLGVLHRVRTHVPAPLDEARAECPPSLARLVSRLLAKNSKDRYSSAGAVVDDLRRRECDADGVAHAMRPSMARQRGRRRQAAVAALLLLISAGIAIGWYGFRDRQPETQIDEDAAPDEPGIVVLGQPGSFETLAAAVAAAPSGGTIELYGNKRLLTDPIRIEGKALTIRATANARPQLAASAQPSLPTPAIWTDSDLTIEGLLVQWTAKAAGPSSSFESAAIQHAAIASTGGTLRLDHCELAVGSQSACVAISGGSAELRNSRLLASQGISVFWKPTAGAKLVSANCVYTARTCISCVAVTYDEASRRDIPASLQLTGNTWQGEKGLQLVFGAAPRRPIEVRAQRNRFGVEHLLTLYWSPRGPRSFRSPSIEGVREMLPRQIRWQEQENAYPASLSFLSAQSPNQPLKGIENGPADVAAWDDFWNNTDSGSRQGTAAAELRGRAGADEPKVGPGARESAERR